MQPNNTAGINYVSADQAAQDQPQPVQPVHHGNWLSHLLPTGGALAGGAGGAALGTMILPGIGTVAGGILGAALGSGDAKAAENAIEHQNLGQGVGSAALEGGAGQALGMGAGAVLGKGAELLGKGAANLAGKQAATSAAQEAIDTAANTYKDVSPQLQKAYNASDSLAHAKAMGFDVAPESLVKLSNTSNDVLNDALNKAINSAGPVDLSHYPQLVKDAIAKESGTLGSYEPTALSRGRLGPSNTAASKLLGQLENLGAGVAKTTSDPNELRTLTTKLGQLAQDAKPSVTAATGAVDPEQRAIYNVINEVRGNVKDALYNRPEVNEALKGVQANVTANPEMGITPELANHLNTTIAKAGQGDKPAQALLDEISRNINIGNLGQAGQDVGQIVTSTGAKARAAAEAGIQPEGASNSPLDMLTGLPSSHGGVLSTAVKGAAHAAQNPAILNTLSRIGNLSAKLAPAAGVAAATAPNLGASPLPTAGSGTMENNMNNTAAVLPGQIPQGGSSYQDLINAMEAQAVLAPSMGGGASSFLGAVAPQLQKNALVGQELSALPQSFANAGGAQGEGGILSRISGLIPGTAAHTYQQQQAGAAQALASALGISPQAAAGLLPQLMQSQQTAGLNQGILGSLSGQLAQ